jgi:probable HAF family extracellular repeat protein
MQDLGVLTFGTGGGGNDVSINDQVVGYMDFVFPAGVFSSHAFSYLSGTNTDLGNLNGQQQRYSEATAVNSSGQIVGWSEIPLGLNSVWNHAFLYQNGAMQDLGTLGQQYSEAYGINNDGDIVGRIHSTNFNHAFIYRSGVMEDLNNLLPPNSGWELFDARDISDTGHIVGTGFLTGFSYSRAYRMSPCGAANTSVGTDVKVISNASDASVQFGTVTTAGTTTFTAIDPNTAGTPPTGYSFCPTCPVYNITTTAVYSAPVTVCLAVPATVDDVTFNLMTLLHFENGAPVDITTTRNANPREICGIVSSLSPFALASPAATPTPTPTVTPTPTPIPPPTTPSNLTAQAVSPERIDLSWSDNSTNEEGFLIERCAEKGKCRTFVEITQVGTGTKTFPDTGLSPGSPYSYRVRAFNIGGNSSYSNTAKARTPRK